MEKEFVTYEIAKKLKELGFNDKCFGYFDLTTKEFIWTILGTVNHKDGDELEYNCISAPLWQQTVDWLRLKHDLWINIIPEEGNDDLCTYIQKGKGDGKVVFGRTWEFSREDFYKAREYAVLKALELIQK